MFIKLQLTPTLSFTKRGGKRQQREGVVTHFHNSTGAMNLAPTPVTSPPVTRHASPVTYFIDISLLKFRIIGIGIGNSNSGEN